MKRFIENITYNIYIYIYIYISNNTRKEGVLLSNSLLGGVC